MPRVPIALALALVPTVGAVSVTAAPAPRAEITPSTVEAAAAPTPVRARWRWPVGPGHDVARPFERPPTPYAAGHRGIDVLSTAGAPVTAVEAGVDAAVILDGRVPHGMLLEIFTRRGAGTLVRAGEGVVA